MQESKDSFDRSINVRKDFRHFSSIFFIYSIFFRFRHFTRLNHLAFDSFVFDHATISESFDSSSILLVFIFYLFANRI